MFWGIHRTNFFIKYNIDLFFLIDKIICMGRVDSLFLPEKIHVIENKSSSWDCNRHVINI